MSLFIICESLCRDRADVYIRSQLISKERNYKTHPQSLYLNFFIVRQEETTKNPQILQTNQHRHTRIPSRQKMAKTALKGHRRALISHGNTHFWLWTEKSQILTGKHHQKQLLSQWEHSCVQPVNVKNFPVKLVL